MDTYQRHYANYPKRMEKLIEAGNIDKIVKGLSDHRNGDEPLARAAIAAAKRYPEHTARFERVMLYHGIDARFLRDSKIEYTWTIQNERTK